MKIIRKFPGVLGDEVLERPEGTYLSGAWVQIQHGDTPDSMAKWFLKHTNAKEDHINALALTLFPTLAKDDVLTFGSDHIRFVQMRLGMRVLE